MFVNNFLESI